MPERYDIMVNGIFVGICVDLISIPMPDRNKVESIGYLAKEIKSRIPFVAAPEDCRAFIYDGFGAAPCLCIWTKE